MMQIAEWSWIFFMQTGFSTCLYLKKLKLELKKINTFTEVNFEQKNF